MRRTWTIALGLTLVCSCRGPGGGGDGGSGDGDADGGESGDALACAEPQPGPAPLRRLTHWEYDNTIRDLLGDDSRPSSSFPTDTAAVGFDNQAALQQVTPALAEEYMRAAEAVAASAVADLDALLPCDPAEIGEEACANELIASLGMRAFRRPLDPAQHDALAALYAGAATEYGFATGVELVIAAMLQSPSFLFRLEPGSPAEGEAVVALDDWERASRLSYFLWGSMPDDELFAAAAAGELATAEQVAAQAERMLQDPRAREMVASFHAQWLGLAALDVLTKDGAAYPAFDDDLRASMAAETRAFATHVVFDDAGDLRTLLTAEFGFADARLADLYDVAGPAGAELERIDHVPGQRAGLLTQASILAATGKPDQSSPVLRGKFVRERLLCQHLPEPPPGVDTTPPEVDPTATTRERFSQHSSDPTCASCHQLIDPIGFGFEHYDGIGAWRADENGLPIDATGVVVALGGEDWEFDGAVELAARLGDDEEVRDCVARQWFTFAQGRAPEGDADACTTDAVAEAFADADGNVLALLVALVQTDAFLYRPAHED